MTRAQHQLTRRTMLRGLFGGAAVSVMLPPFESLFGLTRPAAAALSPDGFPIRFGLYVWGNGVNTPTWTPAATGADWVPTGQLAPLAGHKSRLAVVTGYEVRVANVIPHYSTLSAMITGRPPAGTDGNESMGGPTIDQVLGQEIGGDTRFRTLETGVRVRQPVSHNDAWAPNPSEVDPAALFERLFGVGFRAPGDDTPPDPRIGLRRSVLDVVTDQARDLAGKLNPADKRRLEQHLDGVRELELRLARLLEDPPDLEACVRPSEPASATDRSDPFVLNNEVADLLVMALACDQTRVFSHVFSTSLDNHVYTGTDAGHHRLTHDEPGDQPQVEAIVTQIMTGFSSFLDKLAAIPEGEGTLLDNCCILGTSDVSLGKTHSADEYPIVIAGGAGGRIAVGQHVRSTRRENASDVTLTLARAVGANLPSWGTGDMRSTTTVSALEA